MPAPRLERLASVLVRAKVDFRNLALPVNCEPGACFVVVSEGAFADRIFGVGDVIACGGLPEDGESTVLFARDPARPRLGTVRGELIFGDAGEPCHPVRWSVAGRILEVRHQPRLAAFLRGQPLPAQLQLFRAA